MRGVQMRRPSLYELVDDMKRIDVPALIVTGEAPMAFVNAACCRAPSIVRDGSSIASSTRGWRISSLIHGNKRCDLWRISPLIGPPVFAS